MKLAKVLDGDYYIKSAVEIRQAAVAYVAKQGPEWRVKAFEQLKDGVEGSVKMMDNEIRDCFPYLEQEVKRLKRYVGEPVSRENFEDEEEYECEMDERQENLGSLVNKSMGSSGGFLDFGPPPFQDDGYDNLRPSDPDFEREAASLRTDYAFIIKSWKKVAEQWPDEKEKEELLSKSKYQEPFFRVQGLAEAMASK